MTLCDAAYGGDLEALRDRIARGDDVDGRDETGRAPLMRACISGHHECAHALIDAGAAVDKADNLGRTALMYACFGGHHECAQALIHEGAAVDNVDDDGWTALIHACHKGRHECAQALIDARADVELTNRGGQNALMIACQRQSSSSSAGKAACALTLLESMVPIRGAVVADQAASLKFACQRHRVLEVVLSTRRIKFAPAALVRASVLVSDVHSIIVDFARDMLVQQQLANLKLDGLAIVGDSSTCALRAPIEAKYSY